MAPHATPAPDYARFARKTCTDSRLAAFLSTPPEPGGSTWVERALHRPPLLRLRPQAFTYTVTHPAIMTEAERTGSPVESIAQSVDHLRKRITRAPSVALVLGSGLGGVSESIEDAVRIPYDEIPGFPRATVAGHSGALVAGIWEGVEVVAMQGRFHLYEGWTPAGVAFPLRVLAALGASSLVLTNAAGALRPSLQPGQLMLIADHLNFMFRNPLVGTVHPGEARFPDLSGAYDAGYRRSAHEAAGELGIVLAEGVYAGVLGPSYETPAEIRMLAQLGADVVGMSTVPEAIVAAAIGLRVLAISTITNYGAGLGGALSHEEVLRVGQEASGDLQRLLAKVLPRLSAGNLPSEAAG